MVVHVKSKVSIITAIMHNVYGKYNIYCFFNSN